MNERATSDRRFLLLAILVTAVALLLREQFILTMRVDVPIRGDIRQYVLYALNLYQQGVFSSATGTAPIVPDAFRGPGYPFLLAGTMWATRGDSVAWYPLALHTQAILGALTVLFATLTARRLLRDAGAIASGALLAVWPHHIAATGALLSEVLFGFLLSVAVFAAIVSLENRRIRTAWYAGVLFGFAYLVNPVALFLLPLLVAFQGRALWPISWRLMLAFGFVVAGWSARNAGIPPSNQTGRAAMNLVEGSWPNYHSAWRARRHDPQAAESLRVIAEEEKLLSSDPAAGLQGIARRVLAEPVRYARWYLVEKPYLLWAWGIRIGPGGVYTLVVANSSLEGSGPMKMIVEALRFANPMLFLLALAAVAQILLRTLPTRREGTAPAAAISVAITFAYFTMIHVVFQAEPRYSIPYRAFELILAIYGMGMLLGLIKRHPLHRMVS
jgi:hypothetical protein